MSTIGSPFKNKDFRNWFLAESLLTVSMSAHLAMSLVLIDVSGSLAFAGGVASVIAAMQLIGGVLGGALADHVSRKLLIRRCAYVGIASIASLVILLAGYYSGLYGTSSILVMLIALLAMIVSASEALADPSMDAALKELITPEQYARAMSAAEARAGVVSLASRPATGALYAITPLLPFLIRLICNTTFLVLLNKVKRSFDPSHIDTSEQPFNPIKILTSYKEGMKHVFADPVIRMVILCAPLVNLMVFTGSSWVVFYMRSTNQEAWLIGLVTAGFTIGSLIGAGLSPFLTDRIPSGILAIMGLSWMALSLFVIFLFGQQLPVLFIATIACMIPSPSIGGSLFAHVFARTPSELQGRTLGTFTLCNGFATILAPTLAAAAVTSMDTLTLGLSVIALGLFGILGLLFTPSVRALPALRNL